MMIVANKVDAENRQVTKTEVKEWCQKQHLPFYETSAKEGM